MCGVDKKVKIYRSEGYIIQYVTEFLELVEGEVKKIPVEYRDKALIRIDLLAEQEIEIEIFYVCPKTQEDIEEEERQIKIREKKRIVDLEKELARLKRSEF